MRVRVGCGARKGTDALAEAWSERGTAAMAIRLRRVAGVLVAVCAADVGAEDGDLYLDDEVHHALAAKFARDYRGHQITHAYAEHDLLAQAVAEGDRPIGVVWVHRTSARDHEGHTSTPDCWCDPRPELVYRCEAEGA